MRNCGIWCWFNPSEARQAGLWVGNSTRSPAEHFLWRIHSTHSPADTHRPKSAQHVWSHGTPRRCGTLQGGQVHLTWAQSSACRGMSLLLRAQWELGKTTGLSLMFGATVVDSSFLLFQKKRWRLQQTHRPDLRLQEAKSTFEAPCDVI